MNPVKRFYYIVRITIAMTRLKRWSVSCKDEFKRELCRTLYLTSCFTYNSVKYNWMPKATPATK